MVYIIDGRKNHAACLMKFFQDYENDATKVDSSEDLIYNGYKVVLDFHN